MKPILARIRHTLERDNHLPLEVRLDRLAKSAAAVLAAPVFLSKLDRLGPRARAFGRPRIENRGSIVAGFELSLNSTFTPTELITEPGSRIEIGDEVTINFGTSITARHRIVIGSRVSIGPYCLIDEEHGDGDIRIGDDVWLAARVTVLAGARIGARSVVSAGSVVTGVIPPDALASGVPARVLRVFGDGDGGVSSRPRFAASCGPDPALTSTARALRTSWEARTHSATGLALGSATRGLWPGPSDAIDASLELEGQPFIKNRGRIDWGQGVVIRSKPVQSHVVTGPSGHLRIGSRVVIDHGVAISVTEDVRVGDGTTVGPFVMILDSDHHKAKDHDHPGEPRPIVIGSDVCIGPRVTILRGATIGDGAVIEADSVVCRKIPPGMIAAGVPARPAGAASAQRPADGRDDDAPGELRAR